MHKLLVYGGVLGIVAGGALLTAGWVRLGEKAPRLAWREPEVKPALMTFAYKVYANPKAEFGRHYLSKLVLTNTGDRPVTDLAVSYKLDDYIPWTEPKVLRAVPPGFSFVELYHPKLPPSVTKLRNATAATFHIRLRWKEDGREKEEMFTRDVLLRGVNEIAYTDLPASELTSWFDLFNTGGFTVAMVTPNDPAVALYTAEITKLAGGTTAGWGGGPDEVIRLCRTAYDYMLLTGLRYTGDKGFPVREGEVAATVQTVRLPRDVITSNNGLCIELAVLWSSILEHLGVKTALVFRPGHTYIIAYSPKEGISLDGGLPIECTAITPRAVGRETTVPFEDAVKMAAEDLKEWKQRGLFIIYPVELLQGMGFVPPELADIDTDKLTETLAKRLPAAPQAVVGQLPPVIQAGQPPVQNLAPPVQTAANTWRHPQGYVSVSLPPDFMQLPAGPQTFDFILMSSGNPATYCGCDVMQVNGATDPMVALRHIIGMYGQAGLQVQVTGSAATAQGATLFEGNTASAMGTTHWMCLARPVPGAVVLVSVGAPPGVWASEGPRLQAILNSVRFGP